MHEKVERILAAIAALSDEERAELLQRLASEGNLPSTTQSSLPLQFTSAEIEGSADYAITFDGGSHGNPGPGYGSYAVTRANDGKQNLIRLDFGRTMTNNEAEYEALIAALQGLIERIEATGRSPDDFSVEVRGDSSLVIHQIKGTWKTKDDRMRLLRNRCRELLARFKGYRLIQHGREKSVRVLGH
ncbi:MAG: ribonuclease HI family protein [Anaerolineae bacterium]|jgi:ribonuclease HI